jgi:Flp pilus assembly protein TadG
MPEPRSKKSGFIRRLLPSRLVRRFVRQQDGSAAVEFGMVAVTFLGLTFAILETALVFFAGQTLETAVTDSARLIMTGQAQTGGWSKENFKNAVCTQVYGLFDCAVQMYVDVKTYTSFAAITQTPPVTNGQLDPLKVSYSPGRRRRYRSRHALLRVADLCFAARQQSGRHGQQSPSRGDSGLP